MKNAGAQLIETIRKRKKVDSPLLRYQLEQEEERLMYLIGAENKRCIVAECKERGIPVPNFREHGRRLAGFSVRLLV